MGITKKRITKNLSGGAEPTEAFRSQYKGNGSLPTDKLPLIVVAGNITSEFFVNEIPYLKNERREVYVVCFGKQGKREKEIINQYHLKCIDCSFKDINAQVIGRMLQWLKEKHVRKELRKHRTISAQAFKRKIYVLWYGIYAVIADVKLKDILMNQKFCLYAYWLSRPAYTAAYIKKKYENNCAYSLSRAHGYDLYEERNPLKYLPFREFIGNTMNEICFISMDGMNYYTNHVIPHIEKSPFLKIKRLGTKNQSGIIKQVKEKKSIMLVSCSSVIEIKRLDLIIRTVHYLQANGLSVKWLHIGQGKLLESMKRLAKKLLADGSYRFAGYVNNSKILSIYQKYDADFFINLSDSEGVPVSIMEAISIGLPVIARNVGGNSEIVDETNGCLLTHEVDEQDMKKIMDLVKIRVNNTAIYKEKSDNSRARWENNFNADRNYTRFFENI